MTTCFSNWQRWGSNRVWLQAACSIGTSWSKRPVGKLLRVSQPQVPYWPNEAAGGLPSRAFSAPGLWCRGPGGWERQPALGAPGRWGWAHGQRVSVPGTPRWSSQHFPTPTAPPLDASHSSVTRDWRITGLIISSDQVISRSSFDEFPRLRLPLAPGQPLS